MKERIWSSDVSRARSFAGQAPVVQRPGVAHPAWRARAVGVYRLWRDGRFAVGALLAGIVADALGVDAAVWTVAGLTAVSGLIVALRMYESHQRPAST